MMLRYFQSFCLTVAVGLVVAGRFGCSPNVAGAGSEAEGKVVAGTALYENGTPAVNGTVRLRPADFVGEGSGSGAARESFNTLTTSDGAFSFDSLAADTYMVEIIAGDSLAAAVRCTMDVDRDTLLLGAVSLDTMVSLHALALTTSGEPDKVTFAVRGLERPVLEGEASFRLARGTFEVEVGGYFGVPDSLRVVTASVFEAVDTLKAAPYIEPCTDGSCDSAVVAGIMEVNDIRNVSIGTAATYEDGRVVAVNLNKRGMTVLPDAVGSLTELRDLRIENNAIQELPSFIGKCAKLDTLYVGGNDLTTLPAEIGDCSSLTFLTTGDNRITELPGEIGKLRKLYHFSMQRNQLTTLPSSMADLAALRDLYLANNRISSLPPSIVRLSEIKTLTIRNNRLCDVPDSVAAWIEARDPQWEEFQQCQ